jgi:two-component system, NarL family, response regulator LiaR
LHDIIYSYAMRRIILYSIVLALLLIFMQYVQYRVLLIRHADSLYTGIVALICCAVGIWAGLRWTHKHEHSKSNESITPEVSYTINEAALTQLGITPREIEVLRHMAAGLSNQEIADKMFVSLNTIKTHGSNVFSKLAVQRRTQAIQKAKDLGIL